MANLHRGSGWTGDGERFGVSAAILAGDLCLSWSDEMLARCGLPGEQLLRARGVFDLMRTQLMGGQYLDVLEQVLTERDGGGTTERARRVIQFKSARYSVLRPLQLGAALAGADRSMLTAYEAYGMPLGEAFQLRDDVLGVFGDPAETGKPAGDDLRDGKPTVLVALAAKLGTPAQQQVMDRHLGDPALDRAGVQLLREVIVATGALAQVERMIAHCAAQAVAALEAADVDPYAGVVLRELADAATARRL